MSTELKSVNFMSRDSNPALDFLVHCWGWGFAFDQVRDELEYLGYRITVAEWDLYESLLDLQCKLDMGGK